MPFFEAWKTGVGAPLHFQDRKGSIALPEQDYPRELLQCVQNNAVSRLGAYRAQYWFRLFNVLQSQFPRLGALMGWELFNPTAQRFLVSHPPQAHSLSNLGKGFAEWVQSETGEQHPLWVRAARLDWAHQVAFYAPQGKRIGKADMNDLFAGSDAEKTRLQCHPSLSVVDTTLVWRLERRILQRDVAPHIAEYLDMLGVGAFWLEALATCIERGRLTHSEVPALFASAAKYGWLV